MFFLVPRAARDLSLPLPLLGPSRRQRLPALHILAQDGVDRRLIAAAVLAEESKYVGINAQSDLLFRPRPDNCICKKVRPLLRNVGKVDVLVPERVNYSSNPSWSAFSYSFRSSYVAFLREMTRRVPGDGSANAAKANGPESCRPQSTVPRHSPARSAGTDKKKAPEHLFQHSEIETVLSDVCAILGLVPFQIHCNSKCSYIQSGVSPVPLTTLEYRGR